MCRNITIVGRVGKQSYVVDDHKGQFESEPSKNKHMNVKIIKHKALGLRRRHLCLHVDVALVSLQLAIKGRKSHANLRNQLFNDAFGDNIDVVPDLANIELHTDRGYFSENSFMAILLLCGCMLTCTCPKGKLRLGLLCRGGNDDLRDLREEMVSKSITLACIAFRTGTGKVVMVCSTTHRRLKFDFVTAAATVGKLRHDDRRD